MSLGQRVCYSILMCFLNYWAFFIPLMLLSHVGYQFYKKYLRTNKDTDMINLISRYTWLKNKRWIK